MGFNREDDLLVFGWLVRVFHKLINLFHVRHELILTRFAKVSVEPRELWDPVRSCVKGLLELLRAPLVNFFSLWKSLIALLNMHHYKDCLLNLQCLVRKAYWSRTYYLSGTWCNSPKFTNGYYSFYLELNNLAVIDSWVFKHIKVEGSA